MKFRRQYAFGPYVLDFYCPAKRLAIEVDGSGHLSYQGQVDDGQRTEYLEKRGIRVIRFTNTDVLTELSAVLDIVLGAATHPSPQPSPRRGRGGSASV
jgi:very-short-patch-repair endonuclease